MEKRRADGKKYFSILTSLSFRSSLKRFFLGMVTPPWVFSTFLSLLVLAVVWLRERANSDLEKYFQSDQNILWVYIILFTLYFVAYLGKNKFIRINSLLAVFSLFLLTLYIAQVIDFWLVKV